MLKKHSSPLLCVLFFALSLSAAPAFTQTVPSRPNVAVANDADPIKVHPLDYATSWIGNSYGGEDPNFPNQTLYHVPLDMDSIYVTPDGRVFTNTIWDEGGRAVSVFDKHGRMISPLNDQNGSPNWNNGGGAAVAEAGNQIFVGYAPNGTGIGILDAKNLSNTGLSLSGSSTLPNSHGIFGMTVAKGNLYVTENDFNLVEVFNLSTLTLSQTIPVDNPVRIAVDHAGGLWVSHRDPTPLPSLNGNVFDINGQMGLATVDHFDASGNYVNAITLPDGGEVGALAIDRSENLLVADDGPDQNIKIYSNLEKNPTLVAVFGVQGGDYAGPIPGRVGPLRFRGIMGMGVDADGNIYVSQSGFGLDMGVGHGLTLQSYSWYGALNWERQALEFQTMGAIDPHDETNFYDANHRFKLDYSKSKGQEATYVADTYHRFQYPQDVRVTSISEGGQIVYIQGKKFLLSTPEYGIYTEFYRFEGNREIAIPCVAFDYGSWQGNYQDFYAQPLNGEFIWRDVNGDGLMTDAQGGWDPNEFFQPSSEGDGIPNEHRDGGDLWVDENGDVWQINYGGNTPPYEPSIHLRRYQFQGFDQFGAPIYDYNHMTIYSVPADFPDFSAVGSTKFFPHGSKGGTLYVMGNGPGQGTTLIARYDHWDLGNRTSKFVTNIPVDPDPNNTWQPVSFTVAGDFFFVDYWIPHYNQVFSAKTGLYVGTFFPGKDVGRAPNVGNTDMWQSNRAYKRKNGEYVLLQEEDFQAKILMYRWTPPDPLPPPPTPIAPTGLAQTGADDESVTLSWNPEPSALTYTLSASQTSGGPYTPLVAGIYSTSTYTDIGIQPNGRWYVVLSAVQDTGLSATSSEIVVNSVAAGTTYEAESGTLTGCAGIYAGAQDSAHFRVGCMAPGSTITLSNVTVPTAGTYAMRIYYGNGDNNPDDLFNMGVVVNGGPLVYSPNMPFTGDWSIPGYVTMNVQLNAGANTVVLGNQADDTSGGPDIDRIVVPFAPLAAH